MRVRFGGAILTMIHHLGPPDGQVFAVLMLASHGVSFVTNFIGNKEYRLLKKDPEQLMVAPYRRIFVMMTSVVVGPLSFS